MQYPVEDEPIRLPIYPCNALSYLIKSRPVWHKLYVMQAVFFFHHGGLYDLIIRALDRARQLEVIVR